MIYRERPADVSEGLVVIMNDIRKIQMARNGGGRLGQDRGQDEVRLIIECQGDRSSLTQARSSLLPDSPSLQPGKRLVYF